MDNPNFNPNQQQNPNNAPNQYQQPQGQQPPQGYNPNIPPYQGQYPQYPNQFQPQPPKKDRLKILKICAIGLFVSLVFLANRWIFAISIFAFIAFSIVLVINLSKYVKESNFAKTGKASGAKLTGCGTSFFLLLFFTIALAISAPNTEKSVTPEVSPEPNESISTEIVSEIETDTSIVSSAKESSTIESKAESSKAESKAESKTESKTKSESSSKLEGSSKVESKKTESKVESKTESFVLKDYLFIIDDRDNTFHMINCPKIQKEDIPAGKWHAHDDKGYDNEDMISLMEFDGYHVCSECKDLIKPYDPDEFMDTVSEMNQKQKEAEKTKEQVIFNNNGIKITYTGMDTTWAGDCVKLRVENNSGKNYTIQTRNESVNGMMVTAIFSCDVTNGKTANDEIQFLNSDLEENGITSINNIEFTFHVFNSDDWSDSFDTVPIVINL